MLCCRCSTAQHRCDRDVCFPLLCRTQCRRICRRITTDGKQLRSRHGDSPVQSLCACLFCVSQSVWSLSRARQQHPSSQFSYASRPAPQ
jgi:hypothetical protein